MAICSIDGFLLFVMFSRTRVGAFDAVSKGCSIPSTLMIFAVRGCCLVGEFSTTASRLRLLSLIPRIDRGGLPRKRRDCGFDERRLMPEPCSYVEDRLCKSTQHGRTIGIIEGTNDDLIGKRCRRAPGLLSHSAFRPLP